MATNQTDAGGDYNMKRHRQAIEALQCHDDPFVTSKEVAEELGVSRQAANKWLNELVERGQLDRKKVGSKAVVFWI